MIKTHGYAARSATSGITSFDFERRDPGPEDILIEILYCGICHSDIHTVRDEWDHTAYPVVPGHEIVGRVAARGRRVKGFEVDDIAGVGCFVNSCRACVHCRQGEQQFCPQVAFTYNGKDLDGTPTQGGYSDRLVLDHRYALKIPKNQPLERVAPLMCAGITTYSPLKRAGVRKGTQVGVVGLGGLGHMAVKMVAAMGAEVTVFSTSEEKHDDARRLGASRFVVTKKPHALDPLESKLDFIINTVSVKQNLGTYLSCLKVGGEMTLVGAPQEPHELPAFSLIGARRRLSGSLIGGLRETQEMLDFCARKKVFSDVEVIPPSRINEAYDRAVKGEVKFRFVVDLRS